MHLNALKKAVFLSLIVAIPLAIASLLFGYVNVFLWFNFNGGLIGDFLFNYITYLGDGVIWAILLVIVLYLNKKYWVLLVALAAISTFISQLFKLYLLKDQLRPNSVIMDKSTFHTIKGVYLNDVGSFPSGHTTSIFCFYFFGCCLLPQKWVVPFGFILTVLVAYSRVYQAQHFPIDVAGGIIAAIISIYGAVSLQNKFGIKKS